MASSFQVIADGLARRGFCAVDKHLHAALLRLDHDRLLAQAPHHVEGALRFPAEGELQGVLLDAPLDHSPEFLGDPEEAIGRAEAIQALVRAPMVVILHPEADPLAGRFEAVELGPLEELLPDRLPEALDLPQRLGMMRAATDVMYLVPLQLHLEPGLAAPRGILPAVIGQLFLRNPGLTTR
jgi:hypothetical protein